MDGGKALPLFGTMHLDIFVNYTAIPNHRGKQLIIGILLSVASTPVWVGGQDAKASERRCEGTAVVKWATSRGHNFFCTDIFSALYSPPP